MHAQDLQEAIRSTERMVRDSRDYTREVLLGTHLKTLLQVQASLAERMLTFAPQPITKPPPAQDVPPAQDAPTLQDDIAF